MYAPDILLAFVLDLLLGDPRTAWHPVRWMGKAVSAAESMARFYLPRHLFAGGLVMALALAFGAWDAGYLVLQGLASLESAHPILHGLAYLASALIIFSCLSVRDLGDHALQVAKALEEGDLAAARQAVSKMVGRDTGGLNAAGVLRACLESVAESCCDGVVAPLFYAWLGGAPLVLAYKMVSTLDSMVGYRDARYQDLGKASARLDDGLNWIPARLSVLFIAAAALVMGLAPLQALVAAWRDGAYHPSPNAGRPEAAFAGALGVQLGGPSAYAGHVVDKGFLGLPRVALDVQRLRWGIGLMYASASLVIMAIVCAWILVKLGIFPAWI